MRLTALAMELGRAKEKLATDPEGAATLIDEAHEDAKVALVELRDLARGIHPSVLTDRGLDAAVRGLADRVAGVDGVDGVDGKLSVSSPPGGPTVIRATVPCA